MYRIIYKRNYRIRFNFNGQYQYKIPFTIQCEITLLLLRLSTIFTVHEKNINTLTII